MGPIRFKILFVCVLILMSYIDNSNKKMGSPSSFFRNFELKFRILCHLLYRDIRENVVFCPIITIYTRWGTWTIGNYFDSFADEHSLLQWEETFWIQPRFFVGLCCSIRIIFLCCVCFLSIVLSVHLRFTTSDYLFGIFRCFLVQNCFLQYSNDNKQGLKRPEVNQGLKLDTLVGLVSPSLIMWEKSQSKHGKQKLN